MKEPKLRFKADDGSDFPDWEEKKLGDVCDTLTYGMNAAAVKFDGENKYIRITDIDDESHCYKSDELVSPDGELDNKYLVSENDILLARTGASVGKSYLYNKEDGKLYYAGFLIKAHVKSENSKFIFCQTLTARYDKWVKITSMRSGQPGINANEYSDFTMNVPSLPEQQKIADFLSTIDTIIEKQRATVSAWEERKKGVMQKLFSQEVRFKADDGSDFPDWEEKKFGNVIKEFKEKTKIEDEDTLLSCAIDGVYLNSELFGHQRGQSNVGYLKVKRGTLILSAQNLHLGNANVNMRFEHGIISPAYKTYEVVGCTIEYMNQWVKWDMTKQFFYNATTVGASGCRRNVDWLMLYNQMFIVPSLPEQQKIADCLSALDIVIQKQKETLEKWQELKKGLLQQMFV